MDEETEKWMKENVDKAIANVQHDIDISEKHNRIYNFLKERNFDLNHSDVSRGLREYMFDLMDKWPRLDFEDYCLITRFFKMTESSEIKLDINPQQDRDVLEGNTNLLNEIE
jgi:hypothetical protein